MCSPNKPYFGSIVWEYNRKMFQQRQGISVSIRDGIWSTVQSSESFNKFCLTGEKESEQAKTVFYFFTILSGILFTVQIQYKLQWVLCISRILCVKLMASHSNTSQILKIRSFSKSTFYWFDAEKNGVRQLRPSTAQPR